MRTVFCIAIVCLITGFGCKNSKSVFKVNKPGKDSIIVVRGIAVNAKEGAEVETDDKDFYTIEGKKRWEDSLYEKKVEVKGTYYTIEWKKIKVKKGELYPARPQGTQKMLRNVEITLIK